MRLFVGIPLDPAIAAAAANLAAELQRRTRALAPTARVTWIAEERLHVTLRFIGNVDDDRAERIAAALAAPVAMPAFSLTMRGVGAFPPSGPPRVLWAGIAAGADGLQALEREVTSRLAGIGISAEERPYRPHLTIARVREAAGLRTSRLFDGVGDPTLGTMAVEAITLFESRLSRSGPAYVARQRTGLGRH